MSRRRERRTGDRGSYAQGLRFGGLSVAASMLVGLVSSVVIARAYGVRALGEYAIASAPSLAMGFLATAQEQVAMVRRISTLPPRDPLVTGLFVATTSFSLAFATVVGAILALVSLIVLHGPIDRPDLLLPAVVLIGSSVLFTTPCWNADSLLSGFRAGRELFWCRLTQVLVFLVGALVLSYVFDGATGLIIATALSWALSLVLRCVFLLRYVQLPVGRAHLRAGYRELPAFIRFGLRLAPRNIANGISQQIGTWFLGAMVSVAQVGAYNRASQLGLRFTEVNFRLSEMLIPTLAERRANGDDAGFDRALVDTLRLATTAMLLPAAVGGGAALSIMQVFGSGFGAAADALAFLLLGAALSCLSNVQAQALIASERPGTAAVITVCRAGLTLALMVPLIDLAGIAGAAMAWVAGYALELAWQQHYTRRALSQPIGRLWGSRQVVAQLLACGAGFLVARLLDGATDGVASFLVAGAAGTVAYLATFVLAGGLTTRDRDRLRRLPAAPRRSPGPDASRSAPSSGPP